MKGRDSNKTPMSTPRPPNAIPLSVLDLAPVTAGSTPADALRNTRELAQLADRSGYTRYWLAEHHNMTGIASAATAVVIAHVAGATQRIRVGAGGIMLPNHAPLVIAEQFGTLEALFPGRIDLGLGRAPGSDGIVARALRRTLAKCRLNSMGRALIYRSGAGSLSERGHANSQRTDFRRHRGFQARRWSCAFARRDHRGRAHGCLGRGAGL